MRAPANRSRSARLATPIVLAVTLAVACAASRRAPADGDVTPRDAPRHRETRPAASDDRVLHVVEAGQTVWRIARAYGVEVEALLAANDLRDPRELTAGTALVIPGAAEPLAVAPYPAPPPELPPIVSTPSPGELPQDSPVAAPATLMFPVEGGIVLSEFGHVRASGTHRGLDIGAPPGQPVLAAADGEVAFSGSMRGYGNTVMIDHGDGWVSLYAHNADLLVADGERVRRGQAVATVGRTGNATTPHCHFEVRHGDVALDPRQHVSVP